MSAEEFDYVIVGGGTAASVLAGRLTEDPDTSVLVLEAGPGWIPADVDRPPLWFTLLGSDADWGYTSTPQPGLGGRVTREPRGRLPGGSSNLYIMMHVRGHRADFDAWAYAGAAGWSYDEVLPYFRRLETQEDPGPLSGTEGPQNVVNAALHDPNPTSRTFLEACAELGHPALEDFNGTEMVGAGWHHLDLRDGRRHGALAAYLEPATERPNLTVRTSAHAMRVIVEGGRATGVEYHQFPEPDRAPEGTARRVGAPGPGEGPRTVRAAAEVLVCAGAIETPKLLALSGIGHPERLAALDVPVTAEVPGVGENFHNHVLTGVMAELVSAPPPGTQNLSEAALFAHSAPGLTAPDLQIAYVHVPFDIIVGRDHPTAVSILPGLVRPASRGWVRPASRDPFAKPLVNPDYLGDRSDLDRLVQAVRMSRELFRTEAFGPLVKQELTPGPDVSSDEELRAWVRATADSYHHQAGSARMGVDDASVVDPRLRVHGVEGLRVADASVMPAVPSGNCHTAVVMIAEKAADMIREDAAARSGGAR